MSLVETEEAIDESQLIVPPPEAEPIPRPAPGRKTSEDPTWECVADGIWRNKKAKRKKTLFERPKIEGVFTFRSLHTSTVRLAKEELARRITQRRQGIEPTAKKETPAKNAQRKSTPKADPTDGTDEAEVAKSTTMGDVIRYYPIPLTAASKASYPRGRLDRCFLNRVAVSVVIHKVHLNSYANLKMVSFLRPLPGRQLPWLRLLVNSSRDCETVKPTPPPSGITNTSDYRTRPRKKDI